MDSATPMTVRRPNTDPIKFDLYMVFIILDHKPDCQILKALPSLVTIGVLVGVAIGVWSTEDVKRWTKPVANLLTSAGLEVFGWDGILLIFWESW